MSIRRVEQLTPTPGEWSVERGTNDYDVVVARRNRAVIRLAGYIQSEADADLIAAAPDLLQAATTAWHALKSYENGNASPELARECAAELESALAKAQGRK